MSNAKTLHLQFADGEIEVGTLIDALYEQERTIAMLREHKNDYMDAAEGTRKYLEAELAKLRAGQEPVAHVGGCDCSGLCKQRGLASDEVDTDCKAVYGTPATVQSVNQQLLEALEGMLEIYGVREQHMEREPFASSTEVDCCNQARAAIAAAREGEGK